MKPSEIAAFETRVLRDDVMVKLAKHHSTLALATTFAGNVMDITTSFDTLEKGVRAVMDKFSGASDKTSTRVKLYQQVIRPVEKDMGLRLGIDDLDKVSAVTYSYARDIQFVLHQVLQNALEANTGIIRITLTPTERTLIGRGWVIGVHNNGPALTPETLEHAFELGFSTKSGHRGVGLYTARRIAIEFGGYVTFKNPTSEGEVTVSIIVPNLQEE